MQNRQPNPSRRSFFGGAAAVGAAAAAVATLPHVEPSADNQASEPARPVPENGGGYHLSAHVKQYYKTTRI